MTKVHKSKRISATEALKWYRSNTYDDYELVPICNKNMNLWNNEQSWFWKDVTCRQCLKMRNKNKPPVTAQTKTAL